MYYMRASVTIYYVIIESESESDLKSLSCVRLFVTPWTIRILEWVAYPFSRGSSQPRNRTRVSYFQADSLPAELPESVTIELHNKSPPNLVT